MSGGAIVGGRTAPRILFTDVLVAACSGGGSFGGGSEDLDRKAATDGIVFCGGGLLGGGKTLDLICVSPD